MWDLSIETWKQYNQAMEVYLTTNTSIANQHYINNNAERLFQGIVGAFRKVFRTVLNEKVGQREPETRFRFFASITLLIGMLGSRKKPSVSVIRKNFSAF